MKGYSQCCHLLIIVTKNRTRKCAKPVTRHSVVTLSSIWQPAPFPCMYAVQRDINLGQKISFNSAHLILRHQLTLFNSTSFFLCFSCYHVLTKSIAPYLCI